AQEVGAAPHRPRDSGTPGVFVPLLATFWRRGTDWPCLAAKRGGDLGLPGVRNFGGSSLRCGILLSLTCVVTLVPAASRIAAASWPHDPNLGNVPLCTATGDQNSPTIVSDGAGGTIVAWQDFRGGANTDIYAQRVNAAGAPQWSLNGAALCIAAGNQ